MGGFTRVAMGVAAVLTLACAASPAAAQNRPEQAIVGAMQRFVNSLPFGGLLSPSQNQKSPPPGLGLMSPPGGVPGPAPLPAGPQLQSLAPAPAGPVAPLPLGPGPQLSVPPAAATISPAVPRDVPLSLAARYGRDSAPVNGGVVWRVYAVRPDITGAFRPLREDRTPTPNLALPPGDYVVHVAFGLASAAKTVSLRNEPVREVFDLPAGGVRIEGRVGDARIPHGQIAFDIFSGSQFETGDKRQVASGIATGDVVVVPEGTYHIVSNYGDSNAVVRSDIKVQAGKLTDVTVTHRAAVITLKLVGERGGEALANTSWTVLTPGGDVIKETVGAFPRVVLAEGDYRAIARNEGRTVEREFKVITGVDGEIELLAR
ncbi:hypothetical protein PQJ75_21040 [Rhodoplanes sp. TEM]|uniref:Uncharacterized protein n=2 Tax=Nitrobacteraceae TaxID=41294 RepID=A0ABT5JF51_RHOTP|nr:MULTISPECIES: hypothetical protein [Rhodoplanes]MDC7788296.1 hypothetical protein [Rhodoplanes tepidamans]MDC7986224.1 hypothetical protein [Rhodoplanes sp. TEM]MDQ0355651.1 hypothetical protein [Rhodoplanes tepidamans]